MASKGRGSAIQLYSKAAVEILSHSELSVINGESEEEGEATGTLDQPSSPISVTSTSLIRLSSLEELMKLDAVNSEDEIIPSAGGEVGTYPIDRPYVTLDQLSAQEIRREMFCNTCQTGFVSRDDQVEHYQLDWHRYNLKRKLKGLSPCPQEEFEQMAGDLSSISGSESDSAHSGREDEPRPPQKELSQTPFVYFTIADKNGQKLFAIYRSILTREKRGGVTVKTLKKLSTEQVWVILMRSAGHFAGAVFKGHTVVAHKTFHRYTVRAKRGTAQSVRDAQGGGHGPKSAGATLRRYNETALAQEMQELISSWNSHIRHSTAIFIRTPKYSREILVGGERAPFSKDDSRLRPIPFATRRPTLTEVKRVHSQLASMYKIPLSVLVVKEPAVKLSTQANRTSPNIARRNKRVTEVTESVGQVKISDEGVNMEPLSEADGANRKGGVSKKTRRKKAAPKQEEIPKTVQELLKICCDPEDNVELLVLQLHSLKLRPITDHTPTTSHDTDSGSHDPKHGSTDTESCEDQSSLGMLSRLWNGSTILHMAAAAGNVSIVSTLLLYGADPVVKDQLGKTPYLVSKDKPVRDSFRRFMATHPRAYDYDSAHIPSPLTEDMERGRREKLNEKKKAQKKAKRQREKEMRAVRESERIALAREQRIGEMSDREKRAMAAERRLASQLPTDSAIVRAGRCSLCECSLAGVVPFERLSYKYCSMNCLKQHREQL